MAEQNLDSLQDLKPFIQKPYWDANAEIKLSGVEFEYIYNTFQPFINLGFLLQGVLDRAMNEGIVSTKYEYTDGSGEVDEKDVKAITEEFLKMVEAQKKEAEAKAKADQPVAEPVEQDIKPLNSKPNIVVD